METESAFELDEFEFETKAKYMGIQPTRKYYGTLVGEARWSIENDSFDYAGTHCTWGQSGTHHLPDYAEVQNFDLSEIHLYFEIYDEYTESWFEAERKFFWKNESSRKFIKKFESDHQDQIMQMLQDQEDKHESVVESLSEY